jgi:hypothetical protein
MAQILRAEARPARWEELYQTQQDALALIVQMVVEAIRRLPEPTPTGRTGATQDLLGWVQKGKSSPIAFLFGGRGTGKTTVLTTLVELSRPSRAQMGEAPGDIPPTVSEGLGLIGKRVMWLEPLDMEVVSESTNLLAAILARIEAVCPRSIPREDDADRSDVRGLLDPDFDDPFLQLQQLQSNIALAWDVKAPERRTNLDPDSAAVEVIRLERAKLTLGPTLDLVLHNIAATAFRTGCILNPLFLLPVDDFDLNPPACLQLLRVLRMISLPRLFFVVLGDLDVADVVLNLKLSADLARVAEGAQRTGLLSLEPDEVASVAGTVAANALRKLIPPAQRIILKPLDVLEALNFRPLGHTPQDPFFHQLLAQLPILVFESSPQNRAVPMLRTRSNLRQMLMNEGDRVFPFTEAPRPEMGEGLLTREVLKRASYSALRLLQVPSRKIADLWYACRKIVERFEARQRAEPPAEEPTETTPAPALLDLQRELQGLFADETRAALAEEPVLSPEDRRLVPQVVEQTPTGEWALDQLPFRAVAVTRDVFQLDILEHPWTQAGQLEIHLRCTDGWHFLFDRGLTVRAPGGPTSGTGSGEGARLLSPATAATITLFHDLVVIGPWTPRVGSLLLGRPGTVEVAVTVWRLNLARQVSIPWPAPPCLSFFALERFLFAWNDFLQHVEATRMNPYEGRLLAAFVWIAAGTGAVYGQPPVQLPREVPRPRDWTPLFDRLTGLVPHPEDRSISARGRREWLVGVAFLYMPESGLGDLPEPPDELLAFWRSQWRAISRQRAVHLATVLQRTTPDLAEGLRKFSLPDYLRGRFTPSKKYVEMLAQNLEPADEEAEADTSETAGTRPRARPRREPR